MDPNRNVALVYDVDDTLVRGVHPDILLKKGKLDGVDAPIDTEEFWNSVNVHRDDAIRRGRGNSSIVWTTYFIHELQNGRLQHLSLADIKTAGREIEDMLFPGLPEFFSKISKAHPDLYVSHHLVSAGLAQMLEHSPLAPYMQTIAGYTLTDKLTPGPRIDGLESTVSATEKAEAVRAISKGMYAGSKHENMYEYPMQRVLYFGDGLTDVPAMQAVHEGGGVNFLVYDPQSESKKAKGQRIHGSFIKHFLPADFSEGSELDLRVREELERLRSPRTL